jgi:A/G-specific adenine glycosylase
MLQQTQVAAVIPYFERFLARFPDLASLAAASEDEVLQLWSGLGYYARGRNLLKAAQQIVAQHGGRFPETFEAVADLPGIGRSTAGAILAQAFGQRQPILDGNARRVIARFGALADASKQWDLAEQLLPRTRLADYTQAIMDLGANVCVARTPRCESCPVRRECKAFASERQAEFPARKARRARPLRQASMLLIENRAGQILLERRPSSGIWGGLWCLPMCDADWRTYCRDALRITVTRPRAMPTLRHGFTHFELEIQPVRLKAAASSRKGDWFAPETLSNLGLPTPVRRLLIA